MSMFYPTLLRDRVETITEEDLHLVGATGLLLDVDNTLTAHGSQALSEEVREWLAHMKARGFVPTVVSNAKERRVAPFALKIGLRHIALACKPLPFGFLRAARRLGLRRRQCVVIGDQTFTDILGARLCGMACIQVLPIQMEEHMPVMRFKRRLESRILARFRKKSKD